MKLRRPLPGATEEERHAYMSTLASALNDAGIEPGDCYSVVPDLREDPDRLKFARNSGTSRKAALDNYPRRGSQRHRVLMCISHHAFGLTCDEVEVITGLSHQAASPRVHELQRADFIEADGQRKTRAGSMADVMVLTHRGKREVSAND